MTAVGKYDVKTNYFLPYKSPTNVLPMLPKFSGHASYTA